MYERLCLAIFPFFPLYSNTRVHLSQKRNKYMFLRPRLMLIMEMRHSRQSLFAMFEYLINLTEPTHICT